MMNENPRPKPGRKPTADKAQHCIMVRFTDKEYAKFLSLFEKTGIRAKAVFIKERVFNKEFRVVQTDSSMVEFISKVTNLHAQFRAVGVNINQITKIFQTHFSEKRSHMMLQNLLREVMKLITIHTKVLELLHQIKEEKLPRQGNGTLK